MIFPPNDEMVSIAKALGYRHQYNEALFDMLSTYSDRKTIGDMAREVIKTPFTMKQLTTLVQAFTTGRDGAIYSAYPVSTLNQLSTGTTPVTAVTNPVGLQLDQHLGLALGPELVDTANTAAGWVARGTNTVTDDTGAVKVTFVDDSGGANMDLSAAGGLTTNTTLSKWYKITCQAKVNSGSVNVTVSAGGGDYPAGVVASTTFVPVTLYFMAATATPILYFGASMGAGEIIWIKNISVRLLDGNHSIQATAAARLTWQVDAGGKYYLSALGTDDSYTSATGGAGDAGFFWCGAIQPTGGAGTARYLWNDVGPNTGYIVALTAANKLSINAGNGATYTGNPSVTNIDVGTKYLLTVWDDGTNLNTQVNNGTVITVARPVVVAGTAGFTRFKTNGAASNYFIGYEYASVYFKDTGLTAAAREDMKKLVRSYGGL